MTKDLYKWDAKLTKKKKAHKLTKTKTKVPGLPQSDSNGIKQILSHLLTTREHKDTSVGVVLNRSVCLHRWGGGLLVLSPWCVLSFTPALLLL